MARRHKNTLHYRLKDLLKKITKENLHPEIDFGPPVGEERVSAVDVRAFGNWRTLTG